MPTLPRITIDDVTLGGQVCAICGEQALRIAHVDKLPDYVACGSCGSVFVMEDGGDRVMYGKIPAEYPKTAAVALRQWLAPEVVQGHAMDERPLPEVGSEGAIARPLEPVAGPDEPAEVTSQPSRVGSIAEEIPEDRPSETRSSAGEEPAARFAALLRSYEQTPEPSASEEGMSLGEAPATGPSWENLAEEFEIPEAEAIPPAAAAPPMMAPPESTAREEPSRSAPQLQEIPARASTGEQPLGPGVEPSPGARYNVRIKGYRVRIPKNSCAHCLRIPATRTLAVLAPAPPGSQRRVVRLNLPLCQLCFRRANARSREESSAKLQAHLISALVALLLVVSALGVRLVNLQESPGIGILVLFILAVVGYGAPAFFLLGRSSRFPTPADALYIRSTLIVLPESEPPGLTFSWRNQGSADLFLESNSKAVDGPVVKVPDQIDAGSPQSSLPQPDP